ncbi:MAG: HypC/HybG/HupF family hydrogenase formation chaperone [Endomicrobia bacterium]|nr:HypC/HybG/HupF family hydrogenase formation chaperone [Endomicrobiia bacterium]MCL2507352.1 HypC/HybG/HupF family hydrogenase formation chaperone [Endomicrobiia bacterium]
MCLAVVAKIIKINTKDSVVADFGGGVTSEIKITLLSGLKISDYVLVHAGFAINKITKKDALEIMKASKESGLI